MWNKIQENLKNNMWSYIVLLIALLVCMVTLYNVKGYEVKVNNEWVEWAKGCNCACLMLGGSTPNVTYDGFKFPVINEIKGDLNED